MGVSAKLKDKWRRNPQIQGLKGSWDETCLRLFLGLDTVQKLFPSFDFSAQDEFWRELRAKRRAEAQQHEQAIPQCSAEPAAEPAAEAAGPAQAQDADASHGPGEPRRLRGKQAVERSAPAAGSSAKSKRRRRIVKPSYRIQIMQSQASVFLKANATDPSPLSGVVPTTARCVPSTKAVDLFDGVDVSLPLMDGPIVYDTSAPLKSILGSMSRI